MLLYGLRNSSLVKALAILDEIIVFSKNPIEFLKKFKRQVCSFSYFMRSFFENF